MKSIVLVVLSIAISTNAENFKLWQSKEYMTSAEYMNYYKYRGLLPDWMKIFPGTKWCGDGDIAQSYDDLGEEADTDICCRAHDLCEDVIHTKETKHGLTNEAFHTRLNCQCDIDFHNCLKNVNTSTSNSVGVIYYTLLNTKCFMNEHPIVQCIKQSYFPFRKCIEYELDKTQGKMYQWFDVPNF